MIKPTKRIRQSDLLSLYIFILCANVLSHLLTKGEVENRLKGMKISQTDPTINYLLFVDDVLSFYIILLSCLPKSLLHNYANIN